MSLPIATDNDLGALVDQRVNDLLRQLDLDHAQEQGGGGRGQLAITFMEKRRRKGWFGGNNDEEMVWERWLLNFTLATPRNEAGESVVPFPAASRYQPRTGKRLTHYINPCRNRQAPQSNGEEPGQRFWQDHAHRRQGYRPYTAHYYKRRQPLPLLHPCHFQGRGLGEGHACLLADPHEPSFPRF